MINYKITEPVVQALINYLKLKPYEEVYQILPILLKLEKIERKKKVPSNAN